MHLLIKTLESQAKHAIYISKFSEEALEEKCDCKVSGAATKPFSVWQVV